MVHVKETILICITSPKDDENWFSKLVEYKDENSKPFIHTFNFSLVCRECTKKSIYEWKNCTHNKAVDTPFKNKKSMDKWSKIAEIEGNLDTLLREDQGIITRNKEALFPREAVWQIFDVANRYKADFHNPAYLAQIPRLFCCIDPNADGKANTALVIGYRNRVTDAVIILWLSRRQTKQLEVTIKQFVRDEVIEFRKAYPQLRKHAITFIIENNIRYSSYPIVEDIFRDGIAYKGDHNQSLIGEYDFLVENNVVGAYKTRQKTVHYVLHMSEIIRTGNIAVEQKVGTANTGCGISKIIAEAKEEICRFKWADSDPDNPRYRSYNSKSTISGKEGGRANDDLAIVILMLVYYTFHALKSDEEYRLFLENTVKSFDELKARAIQQIDE